MTVTSHSTDIFIYSRGSFFSQNLTEQVRELVSRYRLTDGLVHINIAHTTSALYLLEYEMGILWDLKQRLERVASTGFSHHRRGVDRNGGAHVISALSGTQQTIQVRRGELSLGTYQDLVFLDFEDQPRVCTASVQLMGDFAA
ncbi:MAG: secondary thiamine-phosphate synthase enzyme YjbQ [Spirochaetaceae bacterium]